MKFMLLMSAPREAFDEYMSWPQEAIDAHTAFMRRFGAKLSRAGELAGAEGLALASDAKLVRAGRNGKPVTDGVFPESKEFLAGYWLVDVATPERALQIAAEASMAPGGPMKRADGSTIDHLWIEVRAVGSGPPES